MTQFSEETRVLAEKRKRGFTLIELLVVIAIIAILAAILFPVFARARENARRSSCSSNLKQIALGVFQYTQDYDEKLPLFFVHGAAPIVGWADAVQPYLKSTQIYQCPSESTGPSSNPASTNYTDYSYNMMLSSDSGGNINDGKSLAVLTQPTLTVLNADDTSYNALSYNWGCGLGSACSLFPAGVASTGGAQRHLDGANFSFTDGHVKWYKGATATTMANVYNGVTPGSGAGVVSGSNPTYNPTP